MNSDLELVAEQFRKLPGIGVKDGLLTLCWNVLKKI